MRRFVPDFLALSVLLALSACSLVVDFPERSAPADDDSDDDDDASDGGLDGGDDESDADTERPDRRDSMVVDAQPGSECRRNEDCESDELCCDRRDGKGAVCVPTSKDECTVCGEACINDSKPNCGARVCECRAGTGQGCASDQICMGSGASARCVECTSREQCPEREQCVDNKCVQCTRGSNEQSSADDVGCSGNTPICGANNTCVPCSASPNNCPNGQTCVGGIGCVGCSPTAPIGDNGCTRATPVCRPVGRMFQCSGCQVREECGLGFCHVASGACTNACDPQGPYGSNSCGSGKPICKLVGNDFACIACSAADCPSGRFCATDGPQAGNCVQCRNNADCGEATVCNMTTGTCRECTGQQVFDNATGQCVECTSDTHCSADKGGLYCHPTQKQCVPCTELPVPNAPCMGTASPTCGPAGVCAGCANDMQCATANAATPLCVSGTCRACTAVTPTATADMRCSTLSATTPACLTTGAMAGRCAACDPTGDRGCAGANGQCDPMSLACVPCVVSQGTLTDDGCAALAPDCVAIPTRGRVCGECDPSASPNRCMGTNACVLDEMTSEHRCLEEADASVP